MIELVAPWLKEKKLVRLGCMEEFSFYDAILRCLYCKYRYMSRKDKLLFIDVFRSELHQLNEDYSDSDIGKALDVMCYNFEVNVLIIHTTAVKTSVTREYMCVYRNKPFVILEQREDKYHTVAVKDPKCGIQVAFYPEDEDDQYVISKLRANQTEIEIGRVEFEETLTKFDTKDMFKAYKS